MKAVIEFANGTWFAVTPAEAVAVRVVLDRADEVQKMEDSLYCFVGKPEVLVHLVPEHCFSGMPRKARFKRPRRAFLWWASMMGAIALPYGAQVFAGVRPEYSFALMAASATLGAAWHSGLW